MLSGLLDDLKQINNHCIRLQCDNGAFIMLLCWLNPLKVPQTQSFIHLMVMVEPLKQK